MAKVLIKTSEGDIKVHLYDETPQHRDNFLKCKYSFTFAPGITKVKVG